MTPPLVLQEKGGVPQRPTWGKTEEDIQEKQGQLNYCRLTRCSEGVYND